MYSFAGDAWAVFIMIFLAEFGDKTFFIAMVLAAKYQASAVFIGCLIGLSISTALAVGIGYGIAKVISKQVLDGIAAGTYFIFAIISLWALRNAGISSDDMMEEAEIRVQDMALTRNIYDLKSNETDVEINKTLYQSASEDEQLLPSTVTDTVINKHMVDAVENSSSCSASAIIYVNILWTVAVAEFLGELGDRTQISVILLTGNYPWIEVYLFAMAAFVIVTAIAIIFGRICAKFLSERMVNIISSIVFFAFGILALAEAITGKDFY